MAFDSDTRNKLARMVTQARQLLTDEFTHQLQEIYGIQPDGAITAIEKLTHLDDEETGTALLLREKIGHLVSGTTTEKEPVIAAIDRTIREQAFTLLNRFAALRLCEERGFIEECVRNGFQSKGFQVYERVAGAALGDTYERYKTFLFCLFDEIAFDLGMLFDRFSPQGLLFPREQALLELFAVINNNDLGNIWSEDETIGWIYQYFNPSEERRAMRAASQAPRNSRELAVRNQFFTPRYVVEFLTENTLGRIWYEMSKGDTALKEECRYLVRRPNEVFLALGEKAPSPEESESDLSQEELLKRPVHIEHRPKKDPRDMRVLDPACGSGHFLLYAFDLLERIYEETWEDPESPKSEIMGRTLREEFETLNELRRDVPKLIIEHNLHGIDIDPRAVQIAALAMWLRAQKTWKKLGIKAAERPRIACSNIVTAEPMPGEEDMRREFTAGLKPRVLGQLVDVVFDKMKLAGEAGSLLKIEEEIKDAVAEARKQWLESPKHEQGVFFPELVKPKPEQQRLRFDLSGVTDEQFWEQAEDRILDALKDYAERAENGHAIRRRLFAEDTAHGFAFIDLCRKGYDVVMMNPPFGESPDKTKEYYTGHYPDSKMDAFAMFVERGTHLANIRGMLGAITSRTGFFLSSFEKWRMKTLLSEGRLETILDLGHGIMDSAMVEAAAYCINVASRECMLPVPAICIRLLNEDDKELAALRALMELIEGKDHPNVYIVSPQHYQRIPGFPLAYWVNKNLLRCFDRFQPFDDENTGRATRCGLGSLDDFRFIRLRWEVERKQIHRLWVPYFSGGTFNPFYEDFPTLVKWLDHGIEVKAFVTQKVGSASRKVQGEDHYFMAGFVFPRRTHAFSPKVMPAGGIFSTAGQAGFLPLSDMGWGICLLSSSTCNELISLSQGAGGAPQFEVGIIKRMPWPDAPKEVRTKLNGFLKTAAMTKRSFDETVEVSCVFVNLAPSLFKKQTLADIAANALTKKNNGLCSIAAIQNEIDAIANTLYRLDIPDEANQTEPNRTTAPDDNEREKVELHSTEHIELAKATISYMLGVILSRWDIRMALDSTLAPKLPDPFDPLSVCPPGMLVGPDGLPAESGRIVSEEWLRARPDANTLPPEGAANNPTIPDFGYPLRISWDGILVDDPGCNGTQPYRDDIVQRVREVLDLLWKDKAHEIEQEACEILGVSDLHDYFRKPSGFFQDHLKRYSKSRRKAPIYWPISSSSGSYTLWIYYHRLTDQTVYACINDYVNPKLDNIAKDVGRLQEQVSKKATAKSRQGLEQLMDLEHEIKDFRDELLRIAALPYKPNLNDGVIITAAPLWRLSRHNKWRKDLKECWAKLEAGEYDWSHLAYTLWPDRVKDKCKKDLSVAIAHGLEDLYEGKINKTKRRGGKKS